MNKLLLAAATLAAVSSAVAAPIAKETTGTDLSDGASWVGGVAPGASDVATWSGSSLGATLTTAGSTSWQGINYSGASAVTIINGASNSTLTLGSAGVTLSGSQNLSYNINGATGGVVVSANSDWNVASGRTFQIGATANGQTVNLGGNTVNLTGTGTVRFDVGGQTISNGTFNVNSGVLLFNAGAGRNIAVANTVSISVASGARMDVAYNSGGGSTFAQALTLNGGELRKTDAGTQSSAFGGTITLGASGGTINMANAGGFNVGSTIGGTGALTIANNGSVTNLTRLSGNNNYSGGTTLNAGILVVGTNTALGTGTLTWNSGTTDITGSTLSAATGSTVTLGNAVTFQSSAVRTFNFGDTANTGKVVLSQALALGGYEKRFTVATGAAVEFQGVVSGSAGGLTKLGAGTMIFSGANTYVGGTRVNAGTLNVASTGAIRVDASGVTVADGATLAVDGQLVLTSATASLANAGTINFATSGSSIFAGNLFDGISGSTYQLITNTGAGSITNGGNTLVNLAGSGKWSAAVLDSSGLITFTAVPEPSTYGLLGAGALAGVAFVRRRRKSA